MRRLLAFVVTVSALVVVPAGQASAFCRQGGVCGGTGPVASDPCLPVHTPWRVDEQRGGALVRKHRPVVECDPPIVHTPWRARW